jgi:hypothetical protein
MSDETPKKRHKCPPGCVPAPIIITDKKGQRYIKIGAKRVKLSPDITEADLIRFLSNFGQPAKNALRSKTTLAYSTKHGIVSKPGQKPFSRKPTIPGIALNKEYLKHLDAEGVNLERKYAKKPGVPGVVKAPTANASAVEAGAPLTTRMTIAELRKIAVDVKGMKLKHHVKKDLLIFDMMKEGFTFSDRKLPDSEAPEPIGGRAVANAIVNIAAPGRAYGSARDLEALNPEKKALKTMTDKATGTRKPATSDISVGPDGREPTAEEVADEVDRVHEMARRLASKSASLSSASSTLSTPREGTRGVAFYDFPHELIKQEVGDGYSDRRARGLSTDQIEDIMDKYSKTGQFLGVVPRDEFDLLEEYIVDQKECGFIFNTDPSTKGGEHWIAVLLTPSSLEYFDSFGDKPTPQFLDDIKPLLYVFNGNTPLKVKWNRATYPEQHDGINCGWFSCKFLIDRFEGDSWREASGWNLKGEHRIEEWKKTLPKFPVMRAQRGEGFIDQIRSGYKKVKDFIVKRVTNGLSGPRNTALPPSVRSFLETFGNKQVLRIEVSRAPIHQIIEKVADFLSNGTWESNKGRAGYDKMFHLHMNITLEDGTEWVVEKNHTIAISPGPKTVLEKMEVPLGTGSLTLSGMFKNAMDSVGTSKFVVYDAVSQNCQFFVKWMLLYSKLLTPALETFIMQDPEIILKDLGLLQRAARLVTDIAGGADRIMHGEGEKGEDHKECSCHK